MSSNTEKNPREEVNPVTLRNGRELEEVEKEPRKVVEKEKKDVDETSKLDESESSKPAPKVKAYKSKVPFPTRLNSMPLINSLLSSLKSLRNCISIYLLLIF